MTGYERATPVKRQPIDSPTAGVSFSLDGVKGKIILVQGARKLGHPCLLADRRRSIRPDGFPIRPTVDERRRVSRRTATAESGSNHEGPRPRRDPGPVG